MAYAPPAASLTKLTPFSILVSVMFVSVVLVLEDELIAGPFLSLRHVFEGLEHELISPHDLHFDAAARWTNGYYVVRLRFDAARDAGGAHGHDDKIDRCALCNAIGGGHLERLLECLGHDAMQRAHAKTNSLYGSSLRPSFDRVDYRFAHAQFMH
jgi:hypothetical protein